MCLAWSQRQKIACLLNVLGMNSLVARWWDGEEGINRGLGG